MTPYNKALKVAFFKPEIILIVVFIFDLILSNIFLSQDDFKSETRDLAIFSPSFSNIPFFLYSFVEKTNKK